MKPSQKIRETACSESLAQDCMQVLWIFRAGYILITSHGFTKGVRVSETHGEFVIFLRPFFAKWIVTNGRRTFLSVKVGWHDCKWERLLCSLSLVVNNFSLTCVAGLQSAMSECSNRSTNICFDSNHSCSSFDKDNFLKIIKDCENHDAIIAFWIFYFMTCLGTIIMAGREVLQGPIL